MRTEVACGVDVGSTNVKVVALDAEGAVVGRAGIPTPRQAGGEVDAEELLASIERLVVAVAGAHFAVRAISTAGVGEDGVLTDAALRPTCRALPWFSPVRAELLAALVPRLAEAPGLPVATDAARTLIGWSWARRQPGTGDARSWVSLADFAAARWSGHAFISDTIAARTAAWLQGSRSWVEARVTATLGSMGLLPPVLPAGTVLGRLRSTTLREADVVAHQAVVVVGGHDHPIGGWGVRRLHAGAVLDSMGTAEVIVAHSSRRDVPRAGLVDVAPGICSSGSTLLTVQELARNIGWAREDVAVAERIDALLSGWAEPDEYVASGVFVVGAPGGERPRYAADAPRDPHSRASAVLGQLAREGTRRLASVATQLAEEPPVFAAGGWTRSPGWLSVKSTALGRRVYVLAEPEVTAVGAALLAAESVGWTPSARVALSGASPDTAQQRHTVGDARSVRTRGEVEW